MIASAVRRRRLTIADSVRCGVHIERFDTGDAVNALSIAKRGTREEFAAVVDLLKEQGGSARAGVFEKLMRDMSRVSSMSSQDAARLLFGTMAIGFSTSLKKSLVVVVGAVKTFKTRAIFIYPSSFVSSPAADALLRFPRSFFPSSLDVPSEDSDDLDDGRTTTTST